MYITEVLLKQTDCVYEVNLYMKSLNKSHLTDFADEMCEQTEGLLNEWINKNELFSTYLHSRVSYKADGENKTSQMF